MSLAAALFTFAPQQLLLAQGVNAASMAAEIQPLVSLVGFGFVLGVSTVHVTALSGGRVCALIVADPDGPNCLGRRHCSADGDHH